MPVSRMAKVIAALLLVMGTASADESARKLKNKVVPPYPELAKQLHIVGLVKLEVLVGTDGRVKSVTVKGGNPVLAESAERAIAKWRYAPGGEEKISVEVNFHPQE